MNTYQVEDPLHEDIHKELYRRVFNFLVKLDREYTAEHNDLKKQLETEYGSKTPILNVPATREECEAAVVQVETNNSEFWASFAPRMKDVAEKWDELRKATRIYEDIVKDWETKDEVMYMDQVDLNWAYLTDGGVEAYMFQKAVLGLVKEQDVDLKRWFYQLMSFGDHLTKKNIERMMVEQKGGCFMSRDLPLEIAEMIFSHCDLEECVALRHVSSFWYTLFNDSEDSLKSKLLVRNPWMRPEGSILSCAECAVVFSARVSSQKWQEEPGDSDTILPVSINRLVASELTFGETLDPAFDSLEHHHNFSRNLCDRVLVEDVVHGTRYMDPWTLETHDVSSILEVIYEADGVLVRKHGLELTLPANSPTPLDVTIEHQFVTVLTEHDDPNQYFYVFDHKNPLHFKYAYTLDVDAHYANDWGEVGGVFRLRHFPPYEHGFFDFSKEDFRHLIYNYPVSWPVAIYQGIVWWRPDRGGTLIPTFMDLRTGQMQYRHAWDLRIDSNWMSLNQVAKEGNTQYVYTTPHNGFRMVDLETRSLTRVDPPEEHNGPMVAGFVDGKFQAKVYKPETLERYAEVNS